MLTQQEISERFFSYFADTPQKDLAQRFDVQQSVISEWKTGKRRIPWNTLIEFAEEESIDLEWLFLGKVREKTAKTPAMERIIPAPARRLPMLRMLEYPTRGLAAADDSGRSAGPDTDEIGYPIRLPETMAFIPIVGESMAPVLLGGQYAVIDMNREGFEKDRGIVIVNILEDRSNPGMPEPVTGTFCKRCERGDGVLYFTSINNYPPFSAWEENCRIWPVLGVWFDDRGVAPFE